MRHDLRLIAGTLIALAGSTLVGCGASEKRAGNFSPAPGAAQTTSRSSSSRNEGPDREEASRLNVSLGQAYLAKGQLEQAMEKLQKAVQLNPKSSDAHTLLAVLYEQINNDKRAEDHYLRAYKLTPELGASNNNLGRFYCARGKFAEGDKHFAAALADPFYKNPETALVNRAACAMRWGKRDLASESLRLVLQAAPEHAQALRQMAQLSFEEKDYMRARAFIERHLSGSPAAPDSLMLGLRIETALGDRRAIESYRRRLLTEFPESDQALSVAKAGNSP
jgi:type IV pilus assembly protein PilF